MKEHNIRISTAGVAQKDGKYFVALRNVGTSIGESWEFPGGKNRYDESPEETLKREYQEELGISIEVGDLVCVSFFSNKEKDYKLMAYNITLLDPVETAVLQDHQRLGWFTLEELKSISMAESDRTIVRYLSDSSASTS